MGRPVNKRFFGEGPGNQIKVITEDGEGFIVRQRSTTRFEVNVGGDVSVCQLVDKDVSELTEGEMLVVVQNDAGDFLNVTKIFNRTVVAGGAKVRWSFEEGVENTVQMFDVEESLPEPPIEGSITIETQPENVTVTQQGDNAVFSYSAVILDWQGSVTEEWQYSTNNGETWLSVPDQGGVTLTVTPANDAYASGNLFRAVITSVDPDLELITNEVLLTINPA